MQREAVRHRQILSLGGLAALLLSGVIAGEPLNAQTALSASLSASVTSAAPVGSMVTWTASATGSSAGHVWYRFRGCEVGPGPLLRLAPDTPAMRRGPLPRSVTCAEADYSIIRDYGPLDTLDWTRSEHEGNYQIEVSARDNDTGATSTATAGFHFNPRVTGSAPAINPTANPLVFLYSAPSCPAGSSMRVQFQGPDGLLQSTNSKPCDGRTMNFYVAGMRPLTVYSMQHVVETGTQAVTGPLLTQATPDASFPFGARTVRVSPPAPMVNPIILQARFGSPAATDPMGNLLWYSLQDISMISRPEPGGLFLGWREGSTFDIAHQILREFDLAGTVLRETNAARVSEQLTAMGMHPIISFHHEVRGLPNGGILALAATERILTDVQGPGPVDVVGDIILVLDRNLQVQWAWDTFDHLDPHRLATLNETCAAASGGCPPIQLAALANDWTHGNSVQLTPDGNILYSARHQDWVIKIDYRNGAGTGDILWRLGKDGDFQFLSSDPYPWFSHQHDANMDASGILKVFDNGNLRNAADPTANSRGQVFQLDEVNHTATPLVNANLGDYSMALGSAQALPNGNYHFHLGYIPTNNSTRIVEVDHTGNIVYDMTIVELQYRSFRMQDLYSP